MEIETHNVQSQNIKKLEFTTDQMQYINTQLPKGYSFLLFTKSIKETKQILAKPKKNKSKIDNDDHSHTIRSVKQFDRSTNFVKKQRPKPPVSFAHSAPIIKEHKIVQKKIKVTQDMIAPELMSCWNLLQILKKHPSSWPFLEPVDHVTLQIPTYLEIIKQPMDFGTIQINLGSGTYETQTQFHADIGKVFMNSYRFNPSGSEYHLITKQLEQFYDLAVENPYISIPQKSKISITQPITNFTIPKKISTNIRTAQVQPFVKSAPKKKKPLAQPQFISMTVAEKKILGQNIRRLPRDSLKGVWQIVNDSNMSPEQLRFDLDKLPLNKVRQLQRYVNSQLEINFKTELIPKDTMQTNASFRQKSQASEDASSFMSDQSN